MQRGRPPVSAETRLYGMFLHPPQQRALAVPALFNALFDQHGIDAMLIPLQVTAEQLAPAIAGMRRLRDFAGFCVTMPHKAAVARLCDVLIPNARPVAVNAVPDSTRSPEIGETCRRCRMVKASAAHRDLGGATRVLLVVRRSRQGHCRRAGPGGHRSARDHEPQPSQRRCARPDGATGGPDLYRQRQCPRSSRRLRYRHQRHVSGVNGDDPLPVDVSRISQAALVVEVVAVPPRTRLLEAATARGLAVVPGMAMMTPQPEPSPNSSASLARPRLMSSPS